MGILKKRKERKEQEYLRGLTNRIDQYNREHGDKWSFGKYARNTFKKWRDVADKGYTWMDTEESNPLFYTYTEFRCQIDDRLCNEGQDCNRCIFAAKRIGLGIETVSTILDD